MIGVMNKQFTKKEGNETVTKDFLYNTFAKDFKKELREELNKDFAKHIAVVMEDNQQRIDVLVEKIDYWIEESQKQKEDSELRFERLENKVFG